MTMAEPRGDEVEEEEEKNKRPVLLEWRSSRGFIIFSVGVAMFTDLFLYAVVIPVLPFALTERVKVAESEVSYWNSLLFAVYGGSLLVGAPICGWLADFTSSRRLPFLLGLAALASATLLLCIGYNIQMLMVARVIQGFSGALMWITGLALLVDTVGREGIGQATSLADIGVTTGTVLAPTLGGLLYENAGYYSVFAISFAILAVDVFLRLVLIEKKAANAWLLAESSRREYGTIKSNSPDDGHRSNGFSSAVQKGGQSNDEGQDPLIDPGSDPEARLRSWDWIVPKTPTTLKVLKSSRIQAALYGLLVQSVVLCSLEAVLPIFLNETFGWRAQGGGLTLLAIAIPSVFAPVVGYLSDRYSPRWITGSLFMIAVPALVLLRFVQKPSMGDISLLLVSLVVLGFTVNCVMSPLIVDLTNAVEDFEQDHPEMFQKAGPYARVYGMMVFSFAAGTMLGPTLGAYIHRHADWPALALFLGLLSASEGLVALLFTDGFILSKRDKGKREAGGVVARV